MRLVLLAVLYIEDVKSMSFLIIRDCFSLLCSRVIHTVHYMIILRNSGVPRKCLTLREKTNR